MLDRRMTESWSQLGAAVRIAQAIGLHRDGSDMVSSRLITTLHTLIVYNLRAWNLSKLRDVVEYGTCLKVVETVHV